jgi:hypothetical protein
VPPESLARIIGGEASYRTRRGPGVWGYWNQGQNATFRHPGGTTMLTYWWGFQNQKMFHLIASLRRLISTGQLAPFGVLVRAQCSLLMV